MMIRTLLRVGQTCLTSQSYLESAKPTDISFCKQYRTFTFQRCLLTCSLMIYVIFLNLTTTMTSANPVFVDHTNFGQFQSARNIRNLPCIVRKSGRSGVCMFAIDCIKQNGTHLGTCIDRFYFGSCCQLKDEILFASEISDNSIDQNTISHFVHESTTLQTISTQTHKNQTHATEAGVTNINKFIHNVTQSYATALTSPTKQTSSVNEQESTTKRPFVHATTHKNSHFVVRTSIKPSQMKNRTTFATTTVKPVRHTTVTTIKPLLTTLQHIVEQRVETSTMPSKIFTFQMVETTNPSFTESLSAEEQFHTTQRPTTSKPIINVTTKPLTQTVFNSTEKVKPKPIVTKRPVIMTTTTVSSNIKKNSTTTKRPITYKPTKNKPTKINATLALDNNIIKTTDKPSSQIYLDNKKVTTEQISANRSTTQKPQRTTTIATTKTPIVISTTLKTTTSTTTTHASTTIKTSTTAKPKPTVTKISAKITTTTTTKPKTTAAIKTTTPTTIATTNKPTTSTKITSTSTTTTTTTTTTPMPSTTLKTTTSTSTSSAQTTEEPETVIKATLATTTTPENRPGLVTWSNLDAEPTTNSSSELDWQPRPPPSDWIIVSTIAPESSTKTTPEQTTDKTNIFTSETATATTVNVSSDTLNENHTVLQSSTKLPNLESFTTAPVTTSNIMDSNMEQTTGYIDTSGEINPMPSATNVIHNETLTSTRPIMSSFDDVNYKQICGRRMFPEPRIVGGSNAAFGRWPWQVSLRQWRTSTYLHKCGAALLNENWAITAAHCVDNVPPSDLLLRLGEYDLAEEEEPYGYQERRVQIVASHPQFDPRTFEYDLALLRFYEPVIFQPNIIPVCVPDSDYDFIGQTAFVTGWGRLYEDGPLPSVLQEVAVPVINNTICESMYRAAGYIEHIPHIFICAGWKKGGYDSCEGDSGGPMVLQREEDKRFVLGGVISWGIGCAEANQPGVYTRISEFRDWINQILQF